MFVATTRAWRTAGSHEHAWTKWRSKLALEISMFVLPMHTQGQMSSAKHFDRTAELVCGTTSVNVRRSRE